MDGEPLTGGNTTPGVVRIDDTVRRPRDSRSAFAARALLALERLGFRGAPRYLGVDDRGRDVLGFVPGRTSSHPSERDADACAGMGALLRELHDLTRDDPIAAGGTCLVHGDPGPFNTVLREGMPAALIDWDAVHAGDPMEDVGYAGWTWCIQAEGHVPVEDQARHLRLLRDGYDAALPAQQLLDAIEERQTFIAAVESRVAADARVGESRRSHALRAVAWAEADARVLAEHRDLFLRRLAQ